jgi:hypothetical protein
LLHLYSISTTEEGYKYFTTDSGLTYFLYFTEYYLKGSEGEDIMAMSFGFYHKPNVIENRKYDPKVKETILHIISDFFETNKEMGLSFICVVRDGYGRHRKITFNKWYKEANDAVEKYDGRDAYAKEGLYTSFLIRADNPLKDYYVDAFYRSIDEYFPMESENVAA